MKNKLKKTAKWLLITITTILLAGTIFEQGAQIYFDTKRPAEKEFRQINGNNIHFVKKGSGGPTVVFQSGLGGDYKIWEEIQNAVSNFTTTISYDRSGLLWSDGGNERKTLDNITEELEQLLIKANCPKPYILVGHSLAGITLRPFVKNNQNDVRAIVFVDVSHPLQIKKSSDELKKYLVVPPTWLVRILVETGIVRGYFYLKPFIADLAETHWMNRHIVNYFYRIYKTTLQEANDDDLMFEEAAIINSFGDIPLTVITAEYPNGANFLKTPALENEYLRLHREGQKDLLSLSTNSTQIIATKSGHYVPLDEPQLVINVIKNELISPRSMASDPE